MRKVLLILIIIVLTIGTGCSRDNEESNDDSFAVALVNGEKIEKEEFDAYVEQEKIQSEQQGVDFESEEGKLQLKQIEDKILDQLIIQELLIQEAKKEDYSVPQEDITKELEKMKGQFADDEQYQEALKQNNMTEKELKDLITDQFMVENFMQSSVEEKEVTQEEMREFYDDYSEQQKESGEEQEIPEFEEVKDQIEENLKLQKMQEEQMELIDELKDNSDIQILLKQEQ